MQLPCDPPGLQAADSSFLCVYSERSGTTEFRSTPSKVKERKTKSCQVPRLGASIQNITFFLLGCISLTDV